MCVLAVFISCGDEDNHHHHHEEPNVIGHLQQQDRQEKAIAVCNQTPSTNCEILNKFKSRKL
jgi:hypothetical protein